MTKLILISIFLIFILSTAFATYVILSNDKTPIKKLCINEELHELTEQQELIKLTTESNGSIICRGVTNP